MEWMRNPILIVILLAAIALLFFSSGIDSPDEGQNQTGSNGTKLEVLVQNLDTPWAIDFLPDGRMIFTERPGRISLFNGTGIRVIGMVEADETGESGLLGLAVDPDFNTSSFIYVYYTSETGNRVSRFILLNDSLLNETVLLDNIPSASIHDGGRMKFGPDGLLYITTGDAADQLSAQNLSSLGGKILRMNKDGTIPQDNLFGNYVYSYGHRNPEGLAWHPVTGQLYASEHGPSAHDEINIIERGANYGWPQTCDEPSGNYTEPIRCYSEFTLAPAGISFNGSDLYIGCLRGSQLRKITLSSGGLTILNETSLFENLGRIREVVAHNGYLYISTSNMDGRGISREGDDKILRMRLS